MACKKSELVAGINSFVSARMTNDSFLMQTAAERLQSFMDSLEYAPEDAVEEDAQEEG